MGLPLHIVLFLMSNFGKGDRLKKPLIIRVSRKEDILAGKIISREEALLGKCVVFGAKPHHIILNFWENTLIQGSCNEKMGKPPQNHCFRNQVTKTDIITILITSKIWLEFCSHKNKAKMGRFPITLL